MIRYMVWYIFTIVMIDFYHDEVYHACRGADVPHPDPLNKVLGFHLSDL